MSVNFALDMMKNAPSKSSPLDPIRTWMFKSLLHYLAAAVWNIINSSLSSGTVPSVCKHFVTPVLKKPGADEIILINYRPISSLSFVSKCLEKIVAGNLKLHLETNHLAESFQSAYKTSHSTETALVKLVLRLV